ncbi:MAG TPA: SurA N-terminal domain-containing protein [Caldimonas sp.]|jgi:peptidyl-prolyl cis-trans isomerase D|nr:SurA N-terminal domain-containing protein [Caldimonas sp.]HEX2541557.1 SurA N-terminal domain-containing protein [Caldimonas sp.]
MFDFLRRHTRALQFLLVLLIFPSFVFFGIQGYSGFNAEQQQVVAKVAGQSITTAELDNSIRERIERARRQMPNLDAKLFDTPEMRGLALENLIRERLMLAAADKLHLVTSDERLERLFKSDPEFAQLRNPDGSVNRDVLASVGMSSEAFAERLRQDISRRQVQQPLTDSVLAPAAAASAALDAMFQQREVQVQRFEVKDQLAKTQPTDAEVEAFYKDPANAAQFRAPEQATVEYVVLDLEALKKGVAITEDELRKHYAQNEKRYTSTEERRASHILIAADKNAPKAERDQARSKAEALLAEVRKNPAAFADIARKHSQDEGSAAKGGDLDFFAKGAIEGLDGAFEMKPGDISGVVESSFGFHIIQVTGTRGGDKRSFESVRAELEAEVRDQLAQKRFADAAVEFGDTVYEQADSLKPAADKWKLEIRTAQQVTRTPGPNVQGPLANAKFLEALFAEEVLREKRNTKAIDIGANQLAAGRVVQYVPAQQLPLAQVKDRVRQQLALLQATAAARKLGTERLAAVRAAPSTALSDSTLIVSRAQGRDLPPQLLEAVLKAPVTALPAFVGVELGDQGYAVAKITKIWGRDPSVADPEKAKAQYAQVWGDAESQAYYAALKARHKVSINDKAAASSEPAASEPR